MSESKQPIDDEEVIGEIGPWGIVEPQEPQKLEINSREANGKAIAILNYVASIEGKTTVFDKKVQEEKRKLKLKDAPAEDLARRIINTDYNDWSKHPIYYTAVASEIAIRAQNAIRNSRETQ